MDALTQTIRDALLAEGASPATADALAVDFVARSRRTLDRERRENLAQQLLPLGRVVAAQRIGCHPNYVYELAERGREKFSGFVRPELKETA